MKICEVNRHDNDLYRGPAVCPGFNPGLYDKESETLSEGTG